MVTPTIEILFVNQDEKLNFKYVIKNDKLHISTILTSCYQIITILIAYLYFKEKINIYRFIGILLVLLGLILIKYK